MKKEDLRIGSFYQSVKFGIPVTCDLSDLYDLCANADGATDNPPIDEMFKPIPLTEAWLFKLGFSNTSEGEFHKDWKFRNVKIRYKKQNEKFLIGVWTDEENDCDIIWIEYVHELQNIFYMINGK